MAKKILAVGPRSWATGVSQGQVLVLIDLPEADTGLVEDLQLALRLTPSECRQLAEALARKADEAEA